MRSVISISDLCWDMSAFTSEYVSLMIARNIFYNNRRKKCIVMLCKQGTFSATILNILLQENTYTNHENKENKEHKSREVNGSKHWICLLNLWEVKVSQDDTKLGKSTQTTTKHLFIHLFKHNKETFVRGIAKYVSSAHGSYMLAWKVLKSFTWVPNTK